MAEIKNIETLQAEISRLKAEISSKELKLREHVKDTRESLRPANLFSAAIRNMFNERREKDKKNYTQKIIEGLTILVGKIFSGGSAKKEEQSAGFFDKAFEKFRQFMEHRRNNRKQERKYYKFDDEYDSESN